MGHKFLLGTLKVVEITYHGQILVCKIGLELNTQIQKQLPQTQFRERKYFFTIDSDVMYLIPYRNNFAVCTKKIALVHHTFSNTKKSRSLIFPRWMFLWISGRMLVRTRNPNVHIYFPIRVYLISRSESLNFGFMVSSLYKWLIGSHKAEI